MKKAKLHKLHVIVTELLLITQLLFIILMFVIGAVVLWRGA